MSPEFREGTIATVITILFFVIPVGFGIAWREPITPEQSHEPLPLEGPLAADGVLRFSSVDDYGRGDHPDECADWALRPADPSVPGLRAVLVDDVDYVVEAPSRTPCAERMPYAVRARCEVERSRTLRLPRGARLAVEESVVTRYYDLEEGDRERCVRSSRGRWVEEER